MIVTRRTLLSGSLFLLSVAGTRETRAQGSGVWIVTAQEAALPPSRSGAADRSISRGPAIRKVSPLGAVRANTPFSLRIEFAARGGDTINLATVQVTLLRGGDIDITRRLKAYVTAGGIDIPDATMAAGTHTLQIAVSDASGRRSVATIEIDAL